MQAFLVDQSNSTLLDDTRPVRPILSRRMVCFIAGVLFRIPIVFFPAGFFLFCGLMEDKWNDGKVTMVAVCAIGALLMLIAGMPDLIRDYRLIRIGQILFGEVVSYTAVTNTHQNEAYAGGGGEVWSDVAVTMEYAFLTPEGKRLVDTFKKTQPTTPKTEPQPGEPVAVLYLDDNKYQVL